MHDIADKNIERLVTAAYRPEALDPGFVKETEDKLRVCARELAQARQQTDPLSAPAPAPALRRLRARLGWAMTAAAVLACVYLLHRAASPRATTIPEPERRFSVGDTRTTTLEKTTRARLTPKPRSAPPAAKPIPNGETVATNAGERRRVVLEDGSVVFLNQRTQIRAGERRIELQKGEVYVEVAPREPGSGATFEVVTPNRTVAALGTHFAVQADEKKSGVLVTQGRVKVSDLDKTLISGQQLRHRPDRIATALPRHGFD
ncbi:MAG: FecR family protein [Gemmataceae bacterium]